jgi:hypothetical protein
MTRRLIVTLPVLLSLIGSAASACSVPVFRYALEHWRPDAYGVIVFHRGELSETQREQLARLQADGGAPQPANLVVQTVDLDQEADEALTALWEEQNTDRLPWMLVSAPPRQGSLSPVWTGEFNVEHVSRVIESPIRQQLKSRLLGGESVVWLFLDSGDKPADDAAYELLQKEAARLEQTLELPVIEEADLSELSLDPEALQLKMSTLRVSRDDSAEQFLVAMLLRVEPDLMSEPYVSQPMAFPVFGRGRALYTLVGAGIAPDTIEEAGRFLTGACQCTVKAQNPGVDLLLAVDWDALVIPALPYDETPPTLLGLAGFSDLPAPQTHVAATVDEKSEGVAAAADSPVLERSSIDSASDRDTDTDAGADAEAGEHTSWVTDDSEARAEGAGGRVAAEQTASAPSIAGNVLLVTGLLAMCVIVATIVLLPRSR